MFGTTSNDNVEVVVKSIPTLEPGIYTEFTLKSIESTNAEKQDGTQGKAILNFIFEKDSKVHTHTEWETEDADKAKNMSLRVKHILKAAGVPEEAVNFSAKSFKEYADKVAGLYKLATSKVDFKVTGSVYNDKKKAGFPNYLGFIVTTGTPLSFSKKELEGNAEYANFKVGASTNELDKVQQATQGLFGLPTTTVFELPDKVN